MCAQMCDKSISLRDAEDSLMNIFAPYASVFSPHPRVNILEHDDRFEVQLAVPGMQREDLHVEVQEGVLRIRGEHKSEGACAQETAHKSLRREFGRYAFTRAYTLPEDVDQESIRADYRDGVLSVTLPKREKAPEQGTRAISIE